MIHRAAVLLMIHRAAVLLFMAINAFTVWTVTWPGQVTVPLVGICAVAIITWCAWLVGVSHGRLLRQTEQQQRERSIASRRSTLDL